MVQEWAAKTHRTVQIVFTIGVEPSGLPGNCFNVLKSAVAHGVRFTVNIMAFDYYIEASKTGIEMGTAAVKALNATHRQLGHLYLRFSQSRLWALEGITLLPGIDDYPKKTEVTYLPDASRVARQAPASRTNGTMSEVTSARTPLAEAARACPDAQARLARPKPSPWWIFSRYTPALSNAVAGAKRAP